MARSFRSLTDEERAGLRVERLRIAVASAGEDVATVSRRAGGVWDGDRTAILNGMLPGTRLAEGQLVKIVVSEPYVPAPRESLPAAAAEGEGSQPPVWPRGRGPAQPSR
jgi:hypothetical protein